MRNEVISSGDWRNQSANGKELLEINKLIENELNAGGLGIGYHLAYLPGTSKDEMLSLFKLAASHQVVNFVLIRHLRAMMPIEAAQDIVITSAVTQSPVHVFHIGSTGLWQVKNILNLFDNAKIQGVDITTEVYPYTAGSATIGTPHIDLDIFEKFGLSASAIE